MAEQRQDTGRSDEIEIDLRRSPFMKPRTLREPFRMHLIEPPRPKNRFRRRHELATSIFSCHGGRRQLQRTKKPYLIIMQGCQSSHDKNWRWGQTLMRAVGSQLSIRGRA
ncbi:hypothetical protein BDV12DRAFT_172627 [Aspergillus spectabilis]